MRVGYWILDIGFLIIDAGSPVGTKTFIGESPPADILMILV